MEVKRFLSVTDHIINQTVYDTVREQIGKVKDVFIDPDSNRPIFVIVATGGFLGLGSVHMVIPWHALEFNTNSHDIRLAINRNELNNAPELDIEKLRNADRDEMDKMFRFYGEGEFKAAESSNEQSSRFEEPDRNAHEGYEGSAQVTDEEPKNRMDEAAENVDESAKVTGSNRTR